MTSHKPDKLHSGTDPKDMEILDQRKEVRSEPHSQSSDIGRSRMDSVSRVAIRNIKPAQLDPNDPDQKRLVEKLNPMEANIWNYSDNQPSFLAKLNKNNPPVQRLVIESIVKGVSLIGSTPGDTLGRTATLRPGNRTGPGTRNDSFDLRIDNQSLNTTQNPTRPGYKGQGRLVFDQSPATRLSTRTDRPESISTPSLAETTSPTEMKVVIKKTIELVADMSKSVELVFHAIRATARFLTYPTPSVPSDNYVFGHVKGWIWLIYKGLSNFDAIDCDDSLLKGLVHKLRTEMRKLHDQAVHLQHVFGNFNKDLKFLHDSVKKEARFLKSQSTMWSLRVDGYLRYAEELKTKRDLLLNVKEDRPFSSDWVFHPHPSKANVQLNFFHFQWIKSKKDWETAEFEIRSDYSTRWHPYSSYSAELQQDLLFHMIDHLAAILEEATNFVKINMQLTFDFDEVKCLRFAVAEINSVKQNKRIAEHIGDMTRKLFEDMALLEEISQEFMDQLDWIVETMDPCYESLKKQISSKLDAFQPLDSDGHRSHYGSCCFCFAKSNQDFLQVFDKPLQAIFLRTPISEETVHRFFPKEYLVYQPNQGRNSYDITTMSCKINQYGVSEGYMSSLFDRDMGRDPPTKMPKRLPKVRRKTRFSDQGFDPQIIVDLAGKAIRTKDNELDTETYLLIFEQIRMFFQAFGSMFNFILSELTERLENLENRLYTELSDYYESLEKMIEHEKSTGIIGRDPVTCGTRAFKRVRIAFRFFTLFIDNLTQLDEHEATSYACKSAYYKSYAKYHSWFVQKTSMFSIYSIPNKTLLYGKVVPDMEVSEADELFKEFVEKAVGIYEHCENVFKSKEIDDL